MSLYAYIITLRNVPESVAAAERCKASAGAHGIEGRFWPAFRASEGRAIFQEKGWPTVKFDRNRYSRPDPCMACYASHAAVWQLILNTRKPAIICEHDAFLTAPFPTSIHDSAWMVNLGKPSYGKFRQPTCGISPMRHKPAPHWLGGAHCYLVRPQAAKRFLELAPTCAEPTDLYLNLQRFPFLTDFFPWIAECREEVSTVQAEPGIAAKHRKVRLV